MMNDEDCCLLIDMVHSEEFPENVILRVSIICMRAFIM